MPHTYASLPEANDELTSAGSTKFAAESATIVALKLGMLESISRLIEAKAERSDFGSGFGPRIGTNRYDGWGRNYLRLNDDLLTVTSITIVTSTGAGSPVTLVADTDYYLLDVLDGYGPGPYRKVLLHRQGVSAFGSGFRVTDVAGTWGHSNESYVSTTTVATGLDAGTPTTFVTSAAPTVYVGHTLLIGTEQLYVTGVSGTTATVVRGVNGTTAATHANGAAIYVYRYPRQVRDVCLRLFQRRWKSRDAGADGTDGGLDVPSQQRTEGEDTIIRRGLFGIRLKEMI